MTLGLLSLVQWGKVEPASGHSFQPKADFNLSLVEYELVPVSGPGLAVRPAERRLGGAQSCAGSRTSRSSNARFCARRQQSLSGGVAAPVAGIEMQPELASSRRPHQWPAVPACTGG